MDAAGLFNGARAASPHLAESMLRHLAYFGCAVLVALASLYLAAAYPLSMLDVRLPAPPWWQLLRYFGSLVPPMAAGLVPRMVVLVLTYLLAFLALRRIWRLGTRGEGTPAQFRGLSAAVGYVGIVSFVAAIALLALAALLGARSGALTGVLMIPAALAVPWAFFLSETGNLLRR